MTGSRPLEPYDEFECKQIFIAHPAIWDHMVRWASDHNMHLDLIPTVDADGALTLVYPEGETPTYGFMPRMPGDR
jgi:hypothetical protein